MRAVSAPEADDYDFVHLQHFGRFFSSDINSFQSSCLNSEVQFSHIILYKSHEKCRKYTFPWDSVKMKNACSKQLTLFCCGCFVKGARDLRSFPCMQIGVCRTRRRIGWCCFSFVLIEWSSRRGQFYNTKMVVSDELISLSSFQLVIALLLSVLLTNWILELLRNRTLSAFLCRNSQ